MIMPRRVELQWQAEMLNLWLNTADIPADARTGLIEMLQTVQREIEELRFDDQRK